MALKSFSFKTNDGTDLWVNRWIPESNDPEKPAEIKAVIVFNHGLAEHSLRYDRFGSILSENGYVFNAFDMRGHGRTAEMAIEKGTGDFGKLADKNGFKKAVGDVDELIDAVTKEYPGVPVILMAHSFGTFIAQYYIENYHGKIKACILSGTAGPRLPLTTAGNIAANIIKFFCGKNSVVGLLDKLSFGSYNARIKDLESIHDWLSKDKTVVQMYDSDKWCGFPLKTIFFCDMTAGLCNIHKKSNMAKIDKDLPIYMLWGSEDPVSDYGKTIRQLAECYKQLGIQNVTLKEYPGDRHEILNETDKDQVEKDILQLLEQTLQK
ncbi:MAG: lysophospholipase [Treponema sp.]|nr:lysophospholipase [Treponema sp.]